MRELSIPIDKEVLCGLRAGDIVTLTGTIYTARDEAHLRALEEIEAGNDLPFDTKGAAIFHCGPIMRKYDDTWHLLAAGPTTSARMNSIEPDFIRATGASAIIGKGGMSQPTIDAMRDSGCIYLAMTGGAAVLAARGVHAVRDVHWLDLGMPEAVWVLDAVHFGPLTVAIDTHGVSLYAAVEEETRRRLPSIKRSLGI